MKACALKHGHALGHIWIERASAPILGDCLATHDPMKLLLTHVIDDRAYHIWRLPDGHLITLYGHKDAWVKA